MTILTDSRSARWSSVFGFRIEETNTFAVSTGGCDSHRLCPLAQTRLRAYTPAMSKAKSKTLTITEFARMGAKAQRKKYGLEQLRAWGKLGGRHVNAKLRSSDK